MSNKKGFTLVELSIVIVIIGFLVAGISAGASMIEQAKLRSVVTDINSFKAAMNTFKATYNGVAGDIVSGDAYFPTCSNNTGLCTGTGLGLITSDQDFVGGNDEIRPALKELALAGLINATIPLVDGSEATLVPGENSPASKFVGVGYMFVAGYIVSSTIPGNVLVIGKSNSTTGLLLDSAFTPLEAYQIDQKIDDGSVQVTALDSIIDYAISFVVEPSYAALPKPKGCTNTNNTIPHFKTQGKSGTSSKSCSSGSDSGNFQYVLGLDVGGEANDLSETTPNVIGVAVVN